MIDHDVGIGQRSQETTENTFNSSLQDRVIAKIDLLLTSYIQNPDFIKHLSLIYGDIVKLEKFLLKFKKFIALLEINEQNNHFHLDFVYTRLNLIENAFTQLNNFTIAINIPPAQSTVGCDSKELVQSNFDMLKKHYSLIKVAIFSLDEINAKIEKITTSIRYKDFLAKINKYLITAADPEIGAVVQMKYLSQSKQLVFPYNSTALSGDEKVAEIRVIKQFNQLFINNCHYLLNAQPDHAITTNPLRMMQQSIINANCKLNNIDGLKEYGVLVVNKTIDQLSSKVICDNYAARVLLQDYFQSFAVIEFIKYDSAFFLQSINQLLNILLKISKVDGSLSNRLLNLYPIKLYTNLAIEHISYIAHIFAYFDDKTFKEFLENNLEGTQIFFNEIFAAFLKEFEKNKSFVNDRERIVTNLLTYLVLLHNNGELFNLIKQELHKHNCTIMQEILSLMFVEISSYDIDLNKRLNVENCFRPWFFHILINHQKSSILFNRFSADLMQILFYVGIDDETVLADKNNFERQEEFDELLANITSQFTYYDRRDFEEIKIRSNIILELLKNLSGVGSLKARALAATEGLYYVLQWGASKPTSEQYFVTAMLKRSDVGYGKKLYEILAKLGYLHFLKEAGKNNADIISRLKVANLNFSKYCDCLENIGQAFDVSKDLNQDFNIPYFLSFSFNAKDMRGEDIGLMMLILYKIFGRTSSNNVHDAKITKEDLSYYSTKISESAKRLLAFYNAAIAKSQEYDIEYQYIAELFTKLKQISLSAIIDGFTERGAEALSEVVDKARLIVDNAINYKMHFVEMVLAKELAVNEDKELKQQTITNFFSAFQEILTAMLQRNGKNLDRWTNDTSSIGEKVAFLCARYKYSEGDFKKWLLKLNPNKEQDSIFQDSLVKYDLVAKHVEGSQDIFDKIQIKHLQHNQKFALSIIYQFLSKPKIENIFMQLGTGQGKSVVIAETARRIISDRLGKQVFIFTCYSHLATRDYQKFKPYFEHFGINSVCCSKDILTEAITQDLDVLINSKVIYANLESYFDLIRKERFKLLQGKRGLNFPDYKQAVLIMDEFDSLILDSDEIHQKIGNFSIGTASIEDMRNKPKIKKLLGEDFINKMNKLDPKLFDNWYDLAIFKLNSGYRPNSSESSLGISSNFVGAFLKYLSITGMGQFLFCYLDPLVFYREFKYMIGFSGSINKDGMKDLSDIFAGKENYYYEIPPFYGVENFQQNRRFTNDPGKIVTEEKEFLNAVVAEVKEKKMQGRPVLLFADLKKNRNHNGTSDFELIEQRLRQEEFLDHKQFNVIQKEEDIKKLPYIGKENAVTLASRILARGADIKVDGHIKEGLHLVVTYYPPRKNVYVQILGRTARQDDKGSYAEITREKPDYYENKVKIKDKQQALHEISEYFFSKVDLEDYQNNERKWPLFLDVLFQQDKVAVEPVKDFIKKNFKCKI